MNAKVKIPNIIVLAMQKSGAELIASIRESANTGNSTFTLKKIAKSLHFLKLLRNGNYYNKN